MNREKLNLTAEQARDILYGETDDLLIIEDKQTGSSRWSIIHKIVIQRKNDKKYFADTYRTGATECQEEKPWEYTEPSFTEVFPVEKTVIVYE